MTIKHTQLLKYNSEVILPTQPDIGICVSLLTLTYYCREKTQSIEGLNVIYTLKTMLKGTSVLCCNIIFDILNYLIHALKENTTERSASGEERRWGRCSGEQCILGWQLFCKTTLVSKTQIFDFKDDYWFRKKSLRY